jgi:hypothetical protein
MRYPGAETFEGMVLWGGGTGGPTAVPGTYQVRLSQSKASKSGGDESTVESTKTDGAKPNPPADVFNVVTEFEILKDPRSSATQEDLQAQFDFLIGVRDKLSEVHTSIKKIRDIRDQIKALQERLAKDPKNEELVASAKQLVKKLTAVEERLYQTKNQSAQDPLNFPIRLNNRLSSLVGVVSTGDNPPTRQAVEVRDQLLAEIDQLLTQQEEIVNKGLSEFNEAVQKAKIPAIFTDAP